MATQRQQSFPNPVSFEESARFAGPIAVPEGSFGDDEFTSARPLSAVKCEQQYVFHPIAQLTTVAAADEIRPCHVAIASGECIRAFATVTLAAVGDSTVGLLLKKNGASVLSATWQIGNSLAAGDLLEASIDPALDEYVAEDVWTVEVDATVGTGTLPRGLLITVVFRETTE